MAEIEKKLEQYRSKKRRQEKLQRLKNTIVGIFMFTIKEEKNTAETQIQIEQNDNKQTAEIISPSNVDPNPDDDPNVCEPTITPHSRAFIYITRTIYIIFWITLYIIAIELQFGIVFLMFSALFGIYLNTRTAPKKPNEISAYSVFNKNCESIDGTLTAEQFEREMRYGAVSVK